MISFLSEGVLCTTLALGFDAFSVLYFLINYSQLIQKHYGEIKKIVQKLLQNRC